MISKRTAALIATLSVFGAVAVAPALAANSANVGDFTFQKNSAKVHQSAATIQSQSASSGIGNSGANTQGSATAQISTIDQDNFNPHQNTVTQTDICAVVIIPGVC
jgi:hypothetical protein